MTFVLCSFIEVNKTSAMPHSSTSRNLSTEANSDTGVNIYASREGTATREHQEPNKAVCDPPTCT